MELISEDHPMANGRKPQCGEQEWTITILLDSGEWLRLRLGKVAYVNIKRMMEQMEIDDAAEGSVVGN